MTRESFDVGGAERGHLGVGGQGGVNLPGLVLVATEPQQGPGAKSGIVRTGQRSEPVDRLVRIAFLMFVTFAVGKHAPGQPDGLRDDGGVHESASGLDSDVIGFDNDRDSVVRR